VHEADAILRSHKISKAARLATIEIIRHSVVDLELCGDFDRWFECDNCDREFYPVLSQKYVAATIRSRRMLCARCGGECVEHETD
jgi:hypothetical protein